jgi:hypothetical protein
MTPIKNSLWLRLRRSALLALVVVLVLPSCGKGRKPVYPASGQVFVNGKPPPDLFVMLHPVDESDPERTVPYAQADEKGHFKLSTYESGDGAPAGKYVVVFHWRERSGLMKKNFDGPDRLKGRYYDPKESQFRVTIVAGPNELPPFHLKMDEK